ncbi:putative mannan endo-1,4-beta-mannosidase [Seiridium unicorne]|uniref:Mannan endo-1,4-beta-mannosidase n=1 Tax=Seiridium unicorne TaxID=138068 RepID=A0ABR2UYW6_9PEZI
MRYLSLVLGGIALPLVLASPLSSISTRATSKSWAGSNLYFLQGLSDSDQDQWISTMSSSGAKVVRVWVNAQVGEGHCEKGSKLANGVPDLESGGLGRYSDETLDLLDKTLVKLSKNGIKAVVSPHDGNALAGDKWYVAARTSFTVDSKWLFEPQHANDGNSDAYCKKWGSSSFYTDQNAATQYDKRIDYILNYQGKTSGKAWKEWGDAIMGFDIQVKLEDMQSNEPFNAKASVCKDSNAAKWVCDRATHMRETLGSDNKIQVSTGGLGGDISNGCTFIESATSCKALDLIAVHKYAGAQSSNPGQWSGAAQSWISQANGKKVYVEEWGVNSKNTDPKTDFPAESEDIIKGQLPYLYWQVLPDVADGCSYSPKNDEDPFGIFVGSGVDFKTEFEKAADSDAAQDWTGIVW